MNNTCKNEPSLKENIKKLLTPIIYRLRHFLNRPSDETQKCLPNLMSSLVTILDHLSEESFEWFLLRIQDWFPFPLSVVYWETSENLWIWNENQNKSSSYADFLHDLLHLLDSLICSKNVFPPQWLQFKAPSFFWNKTNRLKPEFVIGGFI